MFSSGATFGSQSAGFSMGYQATSQPSASQEANLKRPAKAEDRQACLPITLRMAEKALEHRGDQGDLRFHGTEPGQLIVVGCVEALLRDATTVEFTLNDATGRMKARYYPNEAEPKSLEGLASGRYVSVFGNVRTAPTTHFAVAGIRLVSSADEISFHWIEAAHAALRLQKGATEPSTPSKNMVSTSTTMPTPSVGSGTEKLQTPSKDLKPAASGPSSSADAQGTAVPPRDNILVFLRKEAELNAAGVAMVDIQKHFSKYAPEKVKSAMDALVDEGEAFSALDDGRFLAV